MDRREVCGVKAKGETEGRGVNDCFAFELEEDLPNKATTST